MNAAANERSKPRTGMIARLQKAAAGLVGTLRTRLELIGNELAVERIRLVRLAIFAIAGLFCLGLGVLLLFALIVSLNWEGRVGILGGGAALFLLAGGVCLFLALRANTRRQVFAASISELEEDLRQLRALVDQEKSAKDEPAKNG